MPEDKDKASYDYQYGKLTITKSSVIASGDTLSSTEPDSPEPNNTEPILFRKEFPEDYDRGNVFTAIRGYLYLKLSGDVDGLTASDFRIERLGYAYRDVEYDAVNNVIIIQFSFRMV